MADGGYGFSGFDELFDEGYGIFVGAKLVGVNNRNLHDFRVDMSTTSRLADMVAGHDVVLCALSGIQSNEDVRKYVTQGVGAVLVGEALMRAADTSAFIKQLLGWADDTPAPIHGAPPLVKICGIRTKLEALTTASAGADMLGVMLVPSSKRHVSLEQAKEIAAAVRQLRAAREPAKHSDTDAVAGIRNEPWFASHARQLTAAMLARPRGA